MRAETLEGMAQAIARLVADPDAAAAIASQARAHALARYAPGILSARIAAALAAVMGP